MDCGLSSVHGIFQARMVEFLPPGDLPDPGLEPVSSASSALLTLIHVRDDSKNYCGFTKED